MIGSHSQSRWRAAVLTAERHVVESASRVPALVLIVVGLISLVLLVAPGAANASVWVNYRKPTDCGHWWESKRPNRWGDIRLFKLHNSVKKASGGEMNTCADVRRDRRRVGVHGWLVANSTKLDIMSCEFVLKAAVRLRNGREREIINRHQLCHNLGGSEWEAGWGTAFNVAPGQRVIVRSSAFVYYKNGAVKRSAGPRDGWEFST